MNRCLRLMAICFVALTPALTTVGLCDPTDAPQPATPTAGLDIEALVKRGDALIDVILEHHIDPPKRQELWLGGIQEMLLQVRMQSRRGVETRARRTIDLRPDARLKRVSELATRVQFVEFVKEIWSAEPRPENQLSEGDLEEIFIHGLLDAVPGGARLIPAREVAVEEQFRGNRYVGTGIALSFDEELKYPRIAKTIAGGPMQRAGGLDGDLILKIDDRDMQGVNVLETVNLLRGEEGTVIRLVVRAPGANERMLTLTRGLVIFPTLEGLNGPDPDYRVPAARPIRYVKIRQINGSTVHDLRKLERQFKSEGVEALILDFRIGGSLADDPHHAVLLADALLDSGSIGLVRTKSKGREFQADRDRLFRGLPIAVLIDRTTVGSAEWIAAALQDNHAAVLVGDRTGAIAYVFDRVTVPGSGDVLQLATGLFERAGGRAIHRSRPTRDLQPIGQTELAEAPAGGLQPDIQVDAAALQALYGPVRVPGTGLVEQVRTQQHQKLPDAIVAAAIRELESRLAVEASRERTNPQ